MYSRPIVSSPSGRITECISIQASLLLAGVENLPPSYVLAYLQQKNRLYQKLSFYIGFEAGASLPTDSYTFLSATGLKQFSAMHLQTDVL
jgi:hypothetical protein